MKIGKKIIIGLIGFLILAFFILVSLNLFPVAFVSKWFITAKQLDKIVNSSLTYYQKIFSVYATGTPVIDPKIETEIKRAALDKLIEDKIINDILLKKFGVEELDKMIGDKLAGLLINDGIAKASQILYNLSLEDFKNLVLTPEAKREILKERGIDLRKIKESYQPIILIPEFYWQNEVLMRN